MYKNIYFHFKMLAQNPYNLHVSKTLLDLPFVGDHQTVSSILERCSIDGHISAGLVLICSGCVDTKVVWSNAGAVCYLFDTVTGIAETFKKDKQKWNNLCTESM